MKNIKERAEEMMKKMSEQLEIPYSPTLISTFEGLLIEYKEDVFKLMNKVFRKGCEPISKKYKTKFIYQLPTEIQKELLGIKKFKEEIKSQMEKKE